MKKILQFIVSILLGLMLLSIFQYLFLEKKILKNTESQKPTFTLSGGLKFE